MRTGVLGECICACVCMCACECMYMCAYVPVVHTRLILLGVGDTACTNHTHLKTPHYPVCACAKCTLVPVAILLLGVLTW